MNEMMVSACWVGLVVAWLTETRHDRGVLHTIPLAPKGPLMTAKCWLTSPLLSDVTNWTPVRLQSAWVVDAPLFAH